MYQISTRVDGVQRTVDLHELYLPSENTFCHKLDRETLLKALIKLKVPGIERHDGHQALSFKYGAWVQQCQEGATK